MLLITLMQVSHKNKVCDLSYYIKINNSDQALITTFGRLENVKYQYYFIFR